MRCRYFRDRGLCDIVCWNRDSPMWAITLHQKKIIEKYIVCGPNYTLRITILELRHTVDIWHRLKFLAVMGLYASGIWCNISSKVSICLWRLRWSRFICFQKLQLWGVEYPCDVFYVTMKMRFSVISSSTAHSVDAYGVASQKNKRGSCWGFM